MDNKEPSGAQRVLARAAKYAGNGRNPITKRKENNGWISVKDGLPSEHDSMFAKFVGTSKWNPAMFKKSSEEVNVCGVYPDGKTFVTHSRTHDGKWDISSVFQMKITHWQPLPEPPKEDAE